MDRGRRVRVVVQRAFAVIAAVCLVGGIAIAMLLQADAPLAQLI